MTGFAVIREAQRIAELEARAAIAAQDQDKPWLRPQPSPCLTFLRRGVLATVRRLWALASHRPFIASLSAIASSDTIR